MIHLPRNPCILGTASGEAGSGFASLASACDVGNPPDRARPAPNPLLAVSLTATREPPEILVSYGPILCQGCAIDAPFRDVRKGLFNRERQVLCITLLLSSCPLPGLLCFSEPKESLLFKVSVAAVLEEKCLCILPALCHVARNNLSLRVVSFSFWYLPLFSFEGVDSRQEIIHSRHEIIAKTVKWQQVLQEQWQQSVE